MKTTIQAGLALASIVIDAYLVNADMHLAGEMDADCKSMYEIVCSESKMFGNHTSALCDLITSLNLQESLDVTPMTPRSEVTPMTLFAPNNEAIDLMPVEVTDEDDLLDLLMYHVTTVGAMSSEDLECGEKIEMMNGKDTRTICDNKAKDYIYQKGFSNPRNNMPMAQEITKACNGYVYAITQVMLPKRYSEQLAMGQDSDQEDDEEDMNAAPLDDDIFNNMASQEILDEIAFAENVAQSGQMTAEDMLLAKADMLEGPNPCADAMIGFPGAVDCLGEDDADVTVDPNVIAGPQAATNVTKGYNGQMEVDVMPLTEPYYKKGLCPVNVHWHLGAEHYSKGEYDCDDETKCGPTPINERRRMYTGKARQGYQCNFYDPNDEKFTKPYEWKYCDKSMEVGQTYEVHWPHSSAGACGTPDQYQSPFYNGVFCNLPLDVFGTLTAQDVANNVGVQGQIFTIVNDDNYYYPHLFDGMIIDGEFGTDLAIYTGSTTGDSKNNTKCSAYSPITWQVDRKCHMISASSFDKMCADMVSQRNDMSSDLYAHGSRELVADYLAANNHQRELLRGNKKA